MGTPQNWFFGFSLMGQLLAAGISKVSSGYFKFNLFPCLSLPLPGITQSILHLVISLCTFCGLLPLDRDAYFLDGLLWICGNQESTCKDLIGSSTLAEVQPIQNARHRSTEILNLSKPTNDKQWVRSYPLRRLKFKHVLCLCHHRLIGSP